MIFEPTQLCFSSNYIDDFRGLTTVKELLYAVIPPLKFAGKKLVVSPTSKILEQFHKV